MTASNRPTGPWIGRLLVLAAQHAGARIGLLQGRGVLVELARVGGAEQRLVEHGDFLDAAHRALEEEAVAFGEGAVPAALGLLGQRVEPAGDVVRPPAAPSPDRRRSPD